jgi:hypothetical protein
MNKVFDYKKYFLTSYLIKIYNLISNCVIKKVKKKNVEFSIMEISQILTIIF